VQRFTADPEGDPAVLARALWDLDTRAAQGRELRDALARAVRPRERFAAAAAVVRFLRTDPVLPAALLPPGWPGDALHAAYAAYREELAALPVNG
jgi:phenylacetic acid degradation operon negative regulatory protein